MNQNRKLLSPTPVSQNMDKYNYFYKIAGVIAVLAFALGIFRGLYMEGLLVGLIPFVIAYAIKSKIAQTKMYNLRKMRFWLPESLSIQDIYNNTNLSVTLAQNGIHAGYDGKNLRFQSKTITYDFESNSENQFFSLWWHISFGRAFFTTIGISDYNKAIAEMGIIVYAIQCCITQEGGKNL